MTNTLFDDLRMAEKDPSAYPEKFSTESLEDIAANEDLDYLTKNAAVRELTIRKHGIQIYGIFPVSNEDGPGFSYSVGCDRVDLPEMLSFYPSMPSNHFVMNKLYQLMLDCQLMPPTEPGEVMMVDGVLTGDLQVAITLLNKEQRELAYEETTCQVSSSEVPVLHVLMPTPNGDWINSYIPDAYKVDQLS